VEITPLLIYFCIIPFSLKLLLYNSSSFSSDHKELLVSLHNDVVIEIPLSNSSRTVWCYSQANFNLACDLLNKVTGTQCSPMHPTWISCGLPGKRGSSRLRKFVSPRNDFPQKASPLALSIIAVKRRNSVIKSFKRTGSINKFEESDVERYVGWGCILNCFMLSSLPCFYVFYWSAIPTSCYNF